MPLYNLGNENSTSTADEVVGLLSAWGNSQKKKRMMSEVARQAAAGKLEGEYSVDSAGDYKTTYKRPNAKDDAEAEAIRFKLEQARKRAQGGSGGTGNPFSEALDAYPKSYEQDEYGNVVPKTFGSRGGDLIEGNNKIALEELKKYADAMPAIEDTKQLVTQMKAKYDKGNPLKAIPGVKPLQGLGSSAITALGFNPTLNTYLKDKKAFIGNLSRNLGGEKGVLTDQDVSRISSILPSEYSTAEEAQQQWDEINGIIDSKIKRYGDLKAKYGVGKGLGAGGGNGGGAPRASKPFKFNSLEDAQTAGMARGTRFQVGNDIYEVE